MIDIFERLRKIFKGNIQSEKQDDFMASAPICHHVIFSGVVQNVGFRYEVYNQAHSLGIEGWVKNLSDGRVEALLQGEILRIEALYQQLYSVKRFQIDDIEIEACIYCHNLSGFQIKN